MRNFSIVSASIALAALTACATAENVEGVAGGGSGCVACHGGKDNQSGAPPFDVANNSTTSLPSVGAHTTHITQGVTCSACHVDPSKVPAPQHGTRGHGNAEVVFSALADPSHIATYDRATNTCSNVYCHQPTGTPGSLPTPKWNVPAGTITGCGACHEDTSVIHGGGLVATQCVLCHSETVDGTGAIKPGGGKHANGTPDHYQHDPNWAATTDATPHTVPHGVAANYGNPAFPTGFNGCRTCHGSNLDNPIADTVPSCTGCHASHGFANWATNCTFCHGNFGGGLQTDAAPPRDILGNTAASSKHVGAHQAHLFGDATNSPKISNGVACTDCHGGTTGTLPTSFEDHANGTIEVTPKQPSLEPSFAGTPTGSYDSTTGTCSNVYCHGNLPHNGKPNNSVSWTATSVSGCDACHAPQYWTAHSLTTETEGHQVHNSGCALCHAAEVSRNDCAQCHPGYSRPGVSGTVNASTHVNGKVEVVGGTFPITWDPVARTCTTACHAVTTHKNNGAPQTPTIWRAP